MSTQLASALIGQEEMEAMLDSAQQSLADKDAQLEAVNAMLNDTDASLWKPTPRWKKRKAR